MKKRNVLGIVLSLVVGLCTGGFLFGNSMSVEGSSCDRYEEQSNEKEIANIYFLINEKTDFHSDFMIILKDETKDFIEAKVNEGVITKEQEEKIIELLNNKLEEGFSCSRYQNNSDNHNVCSLKEKMSTEEAKEYFEIYRVLSNNETREEYSKIVEKSFDLLIEKYLAEGMITKEEAQMIKEYNKGREGYCRRKNNKGCYINISF